MLHGRDVEAGVQPRVLAREAYPRCVEHNTVPEGGNRRWAEIARLLAKLWRARALHRQPQDHITVALAAAAYMLAGPSPPAAQLASARRAHGGAGGQPSFQGAAAL